MLCEVGEMNKVFSFATKLLLGLNQAKNNTRFNVKDWILL